jgi:predicted alpha/beta-fold hydrolase
MRSLARLALAAGFDVVRLNVRNCGHTEHLTPTLYHSGLTIDLQKVVDYLAPARTVIAGFSMGGNMVLKLAGEWGDNPPPHVAAVCGISVPLQLARCARRLGEARNRLYEKRFLRELRQTLRRKQQLMPDRYPSLDFRGVRTIYDFDDHFTAPAFGFRNADHYYETCSAARFLPSIRLPALLIQAEDDPFIPFEIFADSLFRQNGHLRLATTPHGGHVAFLAQDQPRFWAADLTVRFFQSQISEQERASRGRSAF